MPLKLPFPPKISALQKFGTIFGRPIPGSLFTIFLLLLASINLQGPSKYSSKGKICWNGDGKFPPAAADLQYFGQNYSKKQWSMENCASHQFGAVAAFNLNFDGEGEWGEENSFLFQMDEMPAMEKGMGKKSNEKKELAIKNGGGIFIEKSSKERKEKQQKLANKFARNNHSGEKRKMQFGTQISTSTSMPIPFSTSMGAKTKNLVEERKRSASREIQQKMTPSPQGQTIEMETTTIQPQGVSVSAPLSPHHNITAHLSSHHHHKKGSAIGQRRMGGGGNKQGNWHELSSTEQSISMMLRCQDLETRELLPSAVTCRNLRSDKVCTYLFHEVDRKNGRRDVKCNLQGLEDIAESCRKTCGICCEDINYACEDDKNGIIDCTRQLEKCHQKKWFGVLSRFCAGSCGLCAMTMCRDYDNSCRVRRALCLKSDSVDYMRENCARTCGFCVVGEEENGDSMGRVGGNGGGMVKGGGRGGGEGKSAGGGGGGKAVISGKPVVVEERSLSQHGLVVPECTDKVANCTTNAHLCGSPQFGEYMVKFCTKTCLKCGQPHAGGNGKFPQPPPLEVVIQPLLGEMAGGSSTDGGGNRKTRKCEDQNEKCVQWESEGLCKVGAESNKKFNDEQRTKICPKTCGHCQ